MKKTNTNFFRRYNSLILATFSLVLVVSFGLFYLQYCSRYQNEKEQLETKFLEEATSLDYLLQGGINQLASFQVAAESYLKTHLQQERPSLLFSQIENGSNSDLYNLDQIGAPFTEEMVGNLTGTGSLSNLSEDVRREIEMALSLNPLFQASKENIPNLAWVYYTSKQNFINIYPWVSSTDFQFHPELYEQDFYTLGLPENNPQRHLLWTHAYTDTAGKGLMVTATAPIYDDDTFLGTVALDFTLDILNDFIWNSKTQDIDATRLFIVNQYNELLAHPTLVSSADTEVKSGQSALPEDLQDQLDRVLQKPADRMVAVDGYLILHHSLENAPWQLVMWIPKREMTLAVLAQTDWLFLLLLPGLGLILIRPVGK
jgi:sigma-B regulation protein RsbU (phosphoserine phosphatase)